MFLLFVICRATSAKRFESGHCRTGMHGVVRKGLSSPWIPDGWTWGGMVSDHCPVWVELLRSDAATVSTDAAGMLLQLSLLAANPVANSKAPA